MMATGTTPQRDMQLAAMREPTAMMAYSEAEAARKAFALARPPPPRLEMASPMAGPQKARPDKMSICARVVLRASQKRRGSSL